MIAVCPILPFPPDSGGQKRTMRLLEAAERVGLSPHLLTTDDRDPASAEALRARGWTVEVLAGPPGGLGGRLHQHLRRLPSPFLPAVDARLRELVRDERVLVLLEHTQSAYYADALRGAPTILSLHNVDSELMLSIARAQRRGSRAWLQAWNHWQAMRATERRSLPGADAVLCVSERDAETLAPLSDNIVVAPNGVDADFFATPVEPPPEQRVFFFGQLSYPPNDHGLARFLREGWPAVIGETPAARLRVAGGGASVELRRLAEATAGVEYVGFADDLVAELAACRLTIVPLWAGGGTRLKVLESLAAARPIVGTGLGVEGLGFDSGRHGLIADSPLGLAAGISELLADPERIRAFAANGRAHAEAFRWERALAPVEALYRRLAGAPEPAASA
jgi:glycosyltransferase involved in cell wall biosynthesis